MKGKTLFLLAAVVAAVPQAAFAGELKPCACNPGDAGMSSTTNVVAYGEQFAEPPEGAGKLHSGVVIATLPGPGHVKVAVDSAKAGAAAPDTVLFDFTGQGKFSEAFSTPLAAVEQPGAPKERFGGTFAPATFDFKNGDKVMKVSVAGNYTRMAPGYLILGVAMTCAAEGTCDFGGKSYKVRLLDGDWNFKLGDASNVRDGVIVGDVLLVDTGDGTFTKDVTKSFLDQPIILDGKTYAVTVNDDASAIQAAEADVPMGMVKIDHPNWSARFIGKKYHTEVIGADKPITLPADTYTITNYIEKGEGTKQLMVPQMAGVAEVAAGKTTDVKVGSPLTVGMSAQQSGGNVAFNLYCKDASGAQGSRIVNNATGEMPPPPEAVVFDSGGLQVYQAPLAYG